MNIQLEKKYIQEIENKVRALELEKVKLEQQKEYAEKAINDNLAKMQELGFTPDTIDAGIGTLSNSITVLKCKIDEILNAKVETKESSDEDVLF